MTGPPRCRTCGAGYAPLWDDHLEAVGPCHQRAVGWCYGHAKVRASENGGLAVAELERRSGLAQLLDLFDRRDEREALARRGITYRVRLGSMTAELSV